MEDSGVSVRAVLTSLDGKAEIPYFFINRNTDGAQFISIEYTEGKNVIEGKNIW